MKKIISIILLVCTLTLCLTSCSIFEKENTAENQQKAEDLAIEAATNFYYSTFDGEKAYESYYWTSYEVNIKSSEYVDGDFVILVSLDLDSSGAPWYVYYSQEIKYTITVRRGKAKLVDYELIFK